MCQPKTLWLLQWRPEFDAVHAESMARWVGNESAVNYCSFAVFLDLNSQKIKFPEPNPTARRKVLFSATATEWLQVSLCGRWPKMLPRGKKCWQHFQTLTPMFVEILSLKFLADTLLFTVMLCHVIITWYVDISIKRFSKDRWSFWCIVCAYSMHGSGDNQPNVQKSKIQSYSVEHCIIVNTK